VARGPNGDVFFISAARTPIGRYGGALASLPATELGAVAIRAAIERAGLPPVPPIDEILMGQVLQAGAGQAPTRQAALKAGAPFGDPATTVNRVCGSGLKAIMLATAEIVAGDAEIAVAGGMESMSGAPYLLQKARFGYRLGRGTATDEAILDGLWCAFADCHMGSHAERWPRPGVFHARAKTHMRSRATRRPLPSSRQDASRRSSRQSSLPSQEAPGSWSMQTRARGGIRASRHSPASARPSLCQLWMMVRSRPAP